jgi:hypothetical protein
LARFTHFRPGLRHARTLEMLSIFERFYEYFSDPLAILSPGY